jgi:hypothetical protein
MTCTPDTVAAQQLTCTIVGSAVVIDDARTYDKYEAMLTYTVSSTPSGKAKSTDYPNVA